MSNRIGDSLTLARIAGKIRQVFTLWGYNELLLPAIEPYNPELRDGARYADATGFYLIKPDITSQVAVNFQGIQDIKRAYYVSEVIRDGVTGSWQAGAELFGLDREQGSLEILSIAISVMEILGIEDFRIDVGSTEAWKRITNDSAIDRELVYEALSRHDMYMLSDLGLDPSKREEILGMMNTRGTITGFEELDRLIENVEDNRVNADLSTVKLRNYYDGFVFEIYSLGSKSILGSGGSYTIGGVTAVGFALDIRSLDSITETRKTPRRVKISGPNQKGAYSKGRELVKMGIPVEVDTI